MFLKKNYLYTTWLNEWLISKKDYVKESTYANYTNIVFNYIVPYFHKISLSNVSNELIQNYILHCYEEKKLSVKTIKDIVVVIRMSLKEASNYGLYRVVDTKFKYPVDNTISKVKTLNKREQMLLLNYCKDNNDTKNLGIMLAMFSGIRIGELCGLKYSDLNIKNKEVTINKTVQRIYIKEDKNKGKSKLIMTNAKSKKSNRVIPLHEYFCDIIKMKSYDNAHYLISNKYSPIEPRTFRKYYSKVLQNLKIKHINFHSLRHTFASNCIKNGVDPKTVSELLGHSTVNITLNLYVHSSEEQKRKCINSIYK